MENEMLHVLNRGVDKRLIFLDDQDRLRFIHDLYEFNDVCNVTAVGYYAKNSEVGHRVLQRPKELLVHLHAFCLMPNHYHLLLSPTQENGIPLFMKKLNAGYAKYFNERYERSGALFQGKYKRVPIITHSHFLHIPFYIHFNALDLTNSKWRSGSIEVRVADAYLRAYRWSSHRDYLGLKNFSSVTQRDTLSDFFNESGGYEHVYKETINSYDNSLSEEISLESD